MINGTAELKLEHSQEFVDKYSREGHYPCVMEHGQRVSISMANKDKSNLKYQELFSACKDLVVRDANGMNRKTFMSNADSCFPVTAWIILLSAHFLHTSETVLRKPLPDSFLTDWMSSLRWARDYVDIASRRNDRQAKYQKDLQLKRIQLTRDTTAHGATIKSRNGRTFTRITGQLTKSSLWFWMVFMLTVWGTISTFEPEPDADVAVHASAVFPEAEPTEWDHEWTNPSEGVFSAWDAAGDQEFYYEPACEFLDEAGPAGEPTGWDNVYVDTRTDTSEIPEVVLGTIEAENGESGLHGLRWARSHRKHKPRIKEEDAELHSQEVRSGQEARERQAKLIADSIGLQRVSGDPQWEPKRDEDAWKLELREIVTTSCESELSADQKQALADVVCRYSKMFTNNKENIGCYLYETADIPTVDDVPIFTPRHKLSWAEWAVIDNTANMLVRAGICSKSISPWGCPTVIPPKKDAEGRWTERRVCTDARGLNAKTVRDRYPMPVPEELVSNLGVAKYFTTIDLILSYHQIKLKPDAAIKTAFFTSTDLLQYDRLPMGIRNSAMVLQRILDMLYSGKPFVKAFVDDTLIASKTFELHLEHVDEVLKTLYQAGFRANPRKCAWANHEVKFLGHVITGEGIKPMESKVEAILKIPEPTNVTEVRSFMSSVGYYRQFLGDDLPTVTEPLRNLTKKENETRKFSELWDGKCTVAFMTLKQRMASYPVLQRPNPAYHKVLHTDYSTKGVGCVLAQVDGKGEEHPICYASKTCNPAESRYSATEGECLAVLWAITKYRPYLVGQRFTLITDHSALEWLFTNRTMSGKLTRWVLRLQEYDFEIKHRAGKLHVVPDFLSRNSVGGENTSTEPPEKEDVDELYTGQPLASVSQHMAAVALPTEAQALNIFGTCFSKIKTVLCAINASNLRDIWNDEHVLNYLKHNLLNEYLPWERERVLQRSKNYVFKDDKLYFVDRGRNHLREVPKPGERIILVKKAHEECGHFGVRKTYSMLVNTYFWNNMYEDVKQHGRNCTACNRLRAAFAKDTPMTLNPLPILGMNFRWHCDLAGPFNVNLEDVGQEEQDKAYIFVAVEAFSKWIEVKIIPNKTSECTSEAFEELVLSRYGSPAQVVTDRGDEWKGLFSQLLYDHFIDHAITRGYHPQSNGACEKIVGILKLALRKTLLTQDIKEWRKTVLSVAMGYRMSRQSSTGFSPYLMMLGRNPLIPSGFQNVADIPIDWNDENAAEQSLLQRAELYQRIVPMATDNMLIAQHRDKKRYERRYDKNAVYRTARTIQIGDFVYLERQPQQSLEVSHGPTILLVVFQLPDNTLVLQGKDGQTLKVNIERVALCHIPGLSTTVSAKTDEQIGSNHICELCRLPSERAVMLLCEMCSTGWHVNCLQDAPDNYVQHARADSDSTGAPYYCQYCRNVGRHAEETPVNVAQLNVREQLSHYMPGNWSKGHVRNLTKRLERNLKTPLEYLPTTQSEWRSLLHAIQLDKASYVWDPFAGNATTLRDELPQHMLFFSNDLNLAAVVDTHLDATLPTYYKNFILDHGTEGILITSMPFALSDLIVPMLMKELRNMLICLHVGPNFVSDGPQPRHVYLQQLFSTRETLVIHGNKRNTSGHRGQWLIICPKNQKLEKFVSSDTIQNSSTVHYSLTSEL
jgi:hypothetical protein